MARGAERDGLQRVRRVRMAVVVGREELLDVDEVSGRRTGAGSGIGRHCHVSSARGRGSIRVRPGWNARAGAAGHPATRAPTFRSVEPVAHGPRHGRGTPGVPRWGGLTPSGRAHRVSRPLLIARPFRLSPRGHAPCASAPSSAPRLSPRSPRSRSRASRRPSRNRPTATAATSRARLRHSPRCGRTPATRSASTPTTTASPARTTSRTGQARAGRRRRRLPAGRWWTPPRSRTSSSHRRAPRPTLRCGRCPSTRSW